MLKTSSLGSSGWSSQYTFETESGQKVFVKIALAEDVMMFKGEALGLTAMYGEVGPVSDAFMHLQGIGEAALLIRFVQKPRLSGYQKSIIMGPCLTYQEVIARLLPLLAVANSLFGEELMPGLQVAAGGHSS